MEATNIINNNATKKEIYHWERRITNYKQFNCEPIPMQVEILLDVDLCLKYWAGEKEMSYLWSKSDALFNMLRIIRFQSNMRRFVRKLLAI